MIGKIAPSREVERQHLRHDIEYLAHERLLEILGELSDNTLDEMLDIIEQTTGRRFYEIHGDEPPICPHCGNLMKLYGASFIQHFICPFCKYVTDERSERT